MTTKSDFLEAHDELIQKEFNEIVAHATDNLKTDGVFYSMLSFNGPYGVTKRTAELLIEKYQSDGWEVSIEMKSIQSNSFTITIS